MALLYLLHRFGIKTVAVHCNYQLRGENSDKDQELVEQVCALWGIECVAVRLDPKKTGGTNFQAWARDRRYQIFRDMLVEYNADLITTAHHEDDQIETILQKILRGAGTSAWKGMKMKEKDIIRPLLGVQKSEIMKFVAENNVPYRIDNSNEESTYARNFLRHNWFPLLGRLFPGWRENILKVPGRAEEFEEMADIILSTVQEDSKTLNRQKFLDLPNRIRPVIFYRFYELSGINVPVAASALSGISQLGELQTGKSIQLSGDVFISRERDGFVLETKQDETFVEVTVAKDQLADDFKVGSLVFKIETSPTSFEAGTLTLDARKIEFPVIIREWEEGDVIQPMGMQGSQLISDHLTNRKIKSIEKSRAIVLESFDGTICAVIFPHQIKDGQIGTLSEKYKCSSDTNKTLIIRKK